jgi:hypothetical protein
MDVILTDVKPGAASIALLAIERFADEIYADRATNDESQNARNDLAAIVLPLRAAMDAALARKF